jgi:hypothetical protein
MAIHRRNQGRARTVRAALAGGALFAAGVLALAACGSPAAGGPASDSGPASGTGASPAAGRSAPAIIAQMKAAVRSASSMHMTGELADSGHPVGLNVNVLRVGGLDGTIIENGVPLSLIGAGGKFFIRATRPFLRELHASSVCSVMCGKWVQMSGPQAGQLTGSLSMASLTRSLISELPSFRKAGTATVSGQQCVQLKAADGSILDVAAHGPPYPLRVLPPAGSQGSVTFSQWDKVTAPSAPPSGEVINLGKLKAGTS